jgi:hypothetical protein
VERSEAVAIYAAGREPVVEALLALSARLEAQDAQLAALAERVEELEQRLKRDSRNSSLPPSYDPPWLGKRGRSRGTGRKQGGQPVTASRYGVVYRMDKAGTVTVLHTFTGPDGRTPWAALAQGADGQLYGSTVAGGAFGWACCSASIRRMPRLRPRCRL